MTSSRRERLETMLADDPADQLLRYMLALELDKEGDHARSMHLLKELMDDSPAYVPAYVMAGQQQTRLGDSSTAAAIFRSGIEEAMKQSDEHAAGEMTQFLQELNSGVTPD